MYVSRLQINDISSKRSNKRALGPLYEALTRILSELFPEKDDKNVPQDDYESLFKSLVL